LYSCLPLVCILFSSCKDKDEIQVYRVSKAEPEPAAPESAPATAGMNAMPPAGMPAVDAGGGATPTSQVISTAPSGWEAQPLSTMRQASYLVKGENGAAADISLVILAGPAGGILENINRWESQLGQPAITEEQLGQVAQHVASPLGDVTLVDIEGLPKGADATKDGRIVAGIASGEGRTCFFKMRGNSALAESQKAAFIQWIGTVQMGAAVVDSGAATPVMPDHSAGAEKPRIKWESPQGWKTVAPTTMRYASFSVAGQDGESADISVSVFEGEGGGDLENVNRWRGQLGLEPVDAGALKTLIVPVKCKDAEISTVDMSGPKARILAGWAKMEGKSWFFKLIAPDRMAGKEKANFVKFLQSVQFHP